MARRSKNESEVEAYGFIRDQLDEAGWDIRRPSHTTNGQVWTQNQCLADAAIARALGRTRPENVVRVQADRLWVIEAKANKSRIEQALNEAKNDYADLITKRSGSYRASLATGIAGNTEAGYLVRTHYRTPSGWRPVKINGQEATGFLTPSDVERLLERDSAEIKDYVPNQQAFMKAAERINAILHDGGINKNERAKVMAALLLANLSDPPNLDSRLRVLINDINTRAADSLGDVGKGDFAAFIKIIPPTNQKNHVKYKGALVRTIQELRNLNIRSAMNSDTDVLGQFYEMFLKYGNGAKEIGIVLTPRHVARFAAEALSVSSNDLVLDLACGTGGFLVAAYDRVRRNYKAGDLDRFKKYNIFGIEQEPTIAVLAIVNMIFRGDGKHNISEGNAFSCHLRRKTTRGIVTAEYTDELPDDEDRPVTRVLMNPPFALANSTEKEFHFVDVALKQMVEGGLLFSLLPLDSMFGAREDLVWRREVLLRENTFRAAISFPEELFYPAAQKQVVGIIVERGRPHPEDAPVFWARAAHDGHIKIKSKRLEAAKLDPPRDEQDELPDVLHHLKAFLATPASYSVNVPMKMVTRTIDFSDPILELLPEAYLDSPPVTDETLKASLDAMAREMASFLIRFGKEDMVSKR